MLQDENISSASAVGQDNFSLDSILESDLQIYSDEEIQMMIEKGKDVENGLLLNGVGIYEIHSKMTVFFSPIIAAMVAILIPFSDTMYLPSQNEISQELHAPLTLVSLTISLFFVASAVGQLVWGMLSDHYGRKPILVIALLLFECCTIGIYFVNDINLLIFLRCFQGFFVGVGTTVGSSIIADVFPLETRGKANSFFLTPLLLGPIIAPIVGGFISNSLSWRIDFIVLAVMTIIPVLLIYFALPETQHFFAAKNFELKMENQQEKKIIIDVKSIVRPVLMNPLEPFLILFDPLIFKYYFFASTGFSCIILPIILAQAPYSFNTAIIGLCYIPVGIVTWIGSTTGGILTDKSHEKFSKASEGKLVYPVSMILLVPICTLGFGLSFSFGLPAQVGIFCQCVIAFGQVNSFPGLLSYVGEMYPNSVGTAISLLYFSMFAYGCIFISISVPITNAIGLHYYFLILAISVLIGDIWIISDIFSKVYLKYGKQEKAEK